MNKKKITIVLLLTAFLTAFSAQAKFGYGVIVGTNINELKLTNVKDNFSTDNRAGFNFGATAEYIAPVLGLGFDVSVMYVHQQSIIDYMDENELGQMIPATTKVVGNFFEIPLHIKYKLSLPAVSSYIAPYVFAGPNVSFKFSGDNSYLKTKNTQWGIDLGLGVELIRHLQIGAGYTFGINNVMRKQTLFDPGNVNGDLKVKSNYWTITAAWMF